MVLGPYGYKELALLFHADKLNPTKQADAKEAQRLLGRPGDPEEMMKDAFRRVMGAKGATPVAQPRGNDASAPRGPPPPPLEVFYVDLVPTVGEFGFDLIASFRFGAGAGSLVQEVAVGIIISTKYAEWQCRNFFNDTGELLIQNQALKDKLGGKGTAMTATVHCFVKSSSGKSAARSLVINLRQTFRQKVRIFGNLVPANR
jgi:hypothetical protein